MSENPTKKLFLHIGSEKTGTTALEKILAESSGDLKRFGILYPHLEYSADIELKGNHFILADAAFTGNNQAIKEYMNFIDTDVDGGIDKIVISCEIFFHILDNSSHGRQSIEIIKKWANERGFSLEVIAYLRRQDQLLESLYNQRVKWDGLNSTFDDWTLGVVDFFNYEKKMEKWVGLCDALHIELYEKNNIQGDIVGHFLTRIGAPEDAIAAAKNASPFKESDLGNMVYVEQNLSLSKQAIEAIIALQSLDPAATNYISDAVFQHGDLDFYRQPFDRASLLTDELRWEILDRYRDSNAGLARKFGIGDPNYLFARPKKTDEESPTESYTAVDLLAKLCVKLLDENLSLSLANAPPTPGVITPGRDECSIWFPKGWCRPAGWGAWTLADHAEIVIKTPANSDWIRISFDLTAYVPGDHVQRADLLLGEREVARWHFDATSTDQLPVVEIEVDPGQEVHRFRLNLPHARSPMSFGHSQDHRQLGIGLRKLEIHTRQQQVRL